MRRDRWPEWADTIGNVLLLLTIPGAIVAMFVFPSWDFQGLLLGLVIVGCVVAGVLKAYGR